MKMRELSNESRESIRSIPSILSSACIAGAALLACACTALAGSGSGQSAAFRVDTRSNNVVKVTDVSSSYCHGAYGLGSGKSVYFLAGVDLWVEFTATVEWGGKTASRLEFNGASQNWPNAKETVDVGGLGAGGKLEVVAVATDGTRSPSFRANFDVVPTPLGIPAADIRLSEGSTSYQVDNVSVTLFSGGADALPEEAPFVGGMPFKLCVVRAPSSSLTWVGWR
jgi:hypothetical protein